MSLKTSINKTKLPAGFKLVEEIPGYGCLLDYGCGKWTTHIKKYVEDLGYIYCPYDPNIKVNGIVTADDDGNVISVLPLNFLNYDCIMCCNVLNVILDNDELEKTIRKIKRLSSRDTKVIFQIYEGPDGSGKPTKTQRNEKTDRYLRRVRKHFPKAVRKGRNYIIVK